MTPQEQGELNKNQMDFISRHSAKLGERLDENLRLRDEFAAENTYKFSELLITISVGIMGVAFLSDPSSLTGLSKLLSLVLILPVAVVILELKYRQGVLETNREAHQKRGEKIREVAKASEQLLRHPATSHDELMSVTGKVLELESQAYKEVIDWIREKEPKYSYLRKWSIRLLTICLCGIVAIILNETGSIPWFLSRFSRVCHHYQHLRFYQVIR